MELYSELVPFDPELAQTMTEATFGWAITAYPSYQRPTTEMVRRPKPLTDVSIGEVLERAIRIEPARWTRADQMRVAAYLKKKGWAKYQSRSEPGRHGPRAWRYARATG